MKIQNGVKYLLGKKSQKEDETKKFPTGFGKTTLLNIVGGLDRRSARHE
ncbi:hypothetical protein [Paenibacillus foliorum]|nr:hypothetical protein [Paenibacillus foliorum]